MNITESISKKIGGEISKLIDANKAIQIYANEHINKYQWRDSRFPETCDMWKNKTGDTREEIIEIIKDHINTYYV